MSRPEGEPNYIDRARASFIEKRQIESSSKELFNLSVDLLHEKGKRVRILLSPYKRLVHLANTADPPITIRIISGANLDKAKSVRVYIQGVGVLSVRRSGSREDAKYESSYASGRYPAEAATVKGFLNAVRQVSQEMK